MREIIFRGKVLRNGKWKYGYYQHASDSEGEYDWIIDDLGDTFDVDPATVGQFTGLCDSNGKKIFEHDILHLWDKNSGLDWRAGVEFGNPNGAYYWGWQLHPLMGDYGDESILLWVEMEEGGAYCEVIGNAFDTTELLKDEGREEK